jgi:hypothetical protein
MRAGPVSSRRLAEPTLQSYSSSLRFCAAMTERDSEPRAGFRAHGLFVSERPGTLERFRDGFYARFVSLSAVLVL